MAAVSLKKNNVVFPKEALLPEGIEVLGFVEVPDEKVDGGQVRHRRNYVLTSFQDTLYYLPPFTVKVDGKDYAANQLALKVLTVDVDTTNYEQYFGPKDVQDNPFDWELDDWALPFWLSVLLLVLLAVLYYLYIRLRDNKPVIAHIRIVKRLLPHTDTLRKYIEERYGFNAMEMTSSEIIDQLMKNADQESLAELRQLFLTADLVKFAKYSTLINENDANLVSAVDFINKTKIEQPVSQEPVKPQYTQEEQETRKRRLVLKTTIAVIAAGCVVIFGAIAYYIYELL